MSAPPTEEQLLEAWRWYKAPPAKKRPPLRRSLFNHDRRRNVLTGCTRGFPVQVGQLIEAYGSAHSAARAVEERGRTDNSDDGDWWETVRIILLRVTGELK